MLIKLLKYDYKSMLKTFVPLWAMLLLVSLFNRLVQNSGFAVADGYAFVGSTASSTVYGITTAVLAALLIATFVLCAVLIIQRFFKGLLGDEGYLMFTLPVKTWQLILSKLLVSLSVCVLSALVAFGCWMILMGFELMDTLSLVTVDISSIGLVVVTILIYNAATISRIYLAMSIGHLFHKFRIAISFGAYIALHTLLTQVFSSLASQAATQISYTYNLVGAMVSICPAVILTSGIELLITFAITQLILNKRLNLE